MVYNDFYCINCGHKGIPLPRKKTKEYFHRKKMYCPWCGKIVNHIECHNNGEAVIFLENYQLGLYQEEARESLQYTGRSE